MRIIVHNGDETLGRARAGWVVTVRFCGGISRIVTPSALIDTDVKSSMLAKLFGSFYDTPAGRRMGVIRRPAHHVSNSPTVMGPDR